MPPPVPSWNDPDPVPCIIFKLKSHILAVSKEWLVLFLRRIVQTFFDLFKPVVGHLITHSLASTVSPSQYFPCGVQLLFLVVNPLPQTEGT